MARGPSAVMVWLDKHFPRVKPVDKGWEEAYWRLEDELIPEAKALHAKVIDFGTGACNDLNDPEVDRLAANSIESAKQVLVQLNSLRVRMIDLLGYVPEE